MIYSKNTAVFDKNLGNYNRIDGDILPGGAAGKISAAHQVLSDSDNGRILNVDTSLLADGDVVRSSGKNLFLFGCTWDNLTRDGVTFAIDRADGSISVSSTEASNISITSVAWDNTDARDGSARGIMTIKFPVDTLITVSGNCVEPIVYGSMCFLQVSDGVSSWNDQGYGVTLVAKANIPYAIRIAVIADAKTGAFVHSGLKFRPQVEIGPSMTAYEHGVGQRVVYRAGAANNVEQLFALNPDRTGTQIGSIENNTVRFLHSKHAMIFNVLTALPSANIVRDNTLDGLVNGVSWQYLQKLSFTADTTVYVYGGIPQEYIGKIRLDIYDGTTVVSDTGYGVTFTAKANTEYGIRYYLYAGLECENLLIAPVISTGIYGLRTYFPQTVVTVESGSVLSADYQRATTVKTDAHYMDKLKTLTMLTKRTPMKPRIVMIDDDTSSLALVQRYRDMLVNLGARGNYAVITSRLEEDSNLKDALLGYEKDGFGMLFHCQVQSGAEYFLNDSRRNIASIRNNMVNGIRQMETYGFTNWRYWVTPYGVNDEAIQQVAKEFGFRCMLANDDQDFVGNYGNASRWSIPRVPIGVDPTATARIAREKALIDAVKATNGMLIFTSHVNTWDASSTAPEEAFEIIVRYAQNAGVDICTFAEAFNEREGMFLTTEMLGSLIGSGQYD